MFYKNISQFSFLKSLTPVTLASIAVINSQSNAQAVEFNFSYAPGTTLEQAIGFEMAGGLWADRLTDDVSVNIYVETIDNLSDNTIAGSLPAIQAEQRFDKYRLNLQKDRRSLNDLQAVNSLKIKKDGKKFNALVDDRKLKDIETVSLTRANAKAMGLLSDNSSSQLDGYIVMSNLKDKPVSWDSDYLRNSSASSNSLDYLTVAVHEIGHSLGFVSGVDNPGWLNIVERGQNGEKIDKKEIEYTTPLDLFRYTTESAYYEGKLGEGFPDLSFGKNPYFSLDRGLTGMADFSTGTATNLGGEGKQASHWKSENGAIGIMDALLETGQRRNLSETDLMVMDVIGWNLKNGTKSLSTLNLEAKQRLATKLGVTVEWLDANAVEAANKLGRDRSSDLDSMIDRSQVYEWGRQFCDNRVSLCWRQEGLWQELLWTRLEDMPIASTESTPFRSGEAVPEPSQIGGALLAIIGLRCLFKQKKRSR
jgi:hypothetical protein